MDKRTFEVQVAVAATVEVDEAGIANVVGIDPSDADVIADGCEVWDADEDEWIGGWDDAASAASIEGANAVGDVARAFQALGLMREMFVYMNIDPHTGEEMESYPAGSDVCEAMGRVFDALGFKVADYVTKAGE